jgi:hypothetical protein
MYAYVYVLCITFMYFRLQTLQYVNIQTMHGILLAYKCVPLTQVNTTVDQHVLRGDVRVKESDQEVA